MSRLLKLKPDIEILNRYGYVPDGVNRGKQYRGKVYDNEILIDLNNVPGDANLIFEKFHNLDQYFKTKALLHSFLYICIDQADRFHAEIEGAYETYHLRKSLNEIESFVKMLPKVFASMENEDELEISLKKNRKATAKISHPYSILFLFDSLKDHLSSTSGLLATSGINHAKASVPKNPYRMIGRLQTIFISKVQEFISKESNITPTANSLFNSKQRELIYEAGLILGVFLNDKPVNSSNSDYIKWIHKSNINRFKFENEGK